MQLPVREVLAILSTLAMLARSQLDLTILQGPVTRVVSEQREPSVTFTCTVSAPSSTGSIRWLVIGQDLGSNTTSTADKIDIVNVNSSTLLYSSIFFLTSSMFNSTRVQCLAVTQDIRVESSDALLIIAGPPLPPRPRVQVVNATHLLVSWDQPFSWAQFPILEYNVRLKSGSRLLRDETVTDRHYDVFLDSTLDPCSLLIFEVSARSDVGVSDSGTAQGGFQMIQRPSPYAATSVEVSDGPEAKITFRLPVVCRHQEVYYSVEVYIVGTSKAVYRGVRERVAHSRPDKVGETVISSEFLQEDTFYYAVITFETKPQNTSTIISFNTNTADDNDESSGGESWHIFVLCGAMVVYVVLTTPIIITLAVLYIAQHRKGSAKVMGEGEHEVQGEKMTKQDKADQDDDDSGYIHMASVSLHTQH